MPGIVIQATFDVMQNEPIDSRLVANDQIERLNIGYKYAGLKVYQKDINRTFTYNGIDWDVEGSGLYGGSGSLVGDTVVDFGTVSNLPTNKSLDLIFQADTTGTTKAYLYNNFVRHTTSTPDLEWKGIEYRHQFKYLDDSGNLKNSSYISLNPINTINSQPGAIAFSTGFDINLSEKMRISWDGKVGIKTTDPKGLLQIGTSSNSIVIDNLTNQSIIGQNWFYDSAESYFDLNKGSTKIVQRNGSILLQNRPSGNYGGGYYTTIFTTGTSSGRVGIRTETPTVALDVNGEIRSNNTISGVEISSDNLIFGKQLDLVGITNTSLNATIAQLFTSGTSPLSTTQDRLGVAVGGTAVLYSNGNDVTLNKNTVVYGNIDVVSNSDLTVYGDGQITNFEDLVTITPSTPVYYNSSSDGLDYSDFVALSSFISTVFRFYRVGALTYLDFTFKPQVGISLPSPSTFRGFVFKFTSSRFKPSDYGFGSGYMHIIPSSSMTESIPLSVDVFQNDTDLLLSSGTQILPTLTGSDFYVRVRTHNFGSGFGSAIGNVVTNSEIFKGSIVYKSGVPTGGITPPIGSVPTLTSAPGVSITIPPPGGRN